MKRLALFATIPFFFTGCGQPKVLPKVDATPQNVIERPTNAEPTAQKVFRVNTTEAIKTTREQGKECIQQSPEKAYKLICDLVTQQDIVERSFTAERRSAGQNDQNHLKLISEAQKNEEKLLAELEKEIAGFSAQDVVNLIDTLQNVDRKYRLQSMPKSLLKRANQLGLQLSTEQLKILSGKNIG